MHITEIETKAGEKFGGAIGELNYKEHYIRLADNSGRNIKFSEIKTAVTRGQRISAKQVGDEDVLEKIRYELGKYYHKSEEEIRKILGES